jgi:LacI family transcriptional regulator
MRFEAVTIKDIAKELGISTSTVSRALRDSYEISAETKKLVLECAERLDYRPNPIAQSLKERRSKSIGVVVSEIANNFFSQAINGIESIAYSRGYNVIITQTHESYEREVVNVHHLASRSVDGLLISLSSGTHDLEHIRELHDKGLPVVFFDRVTSEIKTHNVVANNHLGSFHATEHLIYQGYKQIAHITNAPELSITKERLEGYKSALEKHAIPFNEKLVKYCHHGGMKEDEIEKAVKELLSLKTKPDAIFTASDRVTIACLRAVKNLKKKMPHLGFTGFTNTTFGDLFSPTLTVIRQPAFEIGEVATELLLSLIEAKRPVQDFTNKVLDTELIIRESSIKAT